jgi:hypothetical protein
MKMRKLKKPKYLVKWPKCSIAAPLMLMGGFILADTLNAVRRPASNKSRSANLADCRGFKAPVL